MQFATKITDKLKTLDGLKDSERYQQNTGSYSKISRKVLEGEIVALKKIKPEARSSLEKRAQIFFREVTDQILAGHPSVLPVLGFNFFHYSKKNEMFLYKPRLATKFCDEGMLSEVLKKMKKNKKLSKKYIQTQNYIFAYGIAKGMENLFINRILHRDLKSENIFVSKPTFENGNIPNDIMPLFKNKEYMIPFIADLGLAKVAVVTEQSLQCGTYYYLAPEVMSSKNYYFPVDVYSYAIILSNIFQLKEKPIFNCKKIAYHFIQHVTNGNRPLVDECTEDQQKYLNKLWATDPNSRPTFIDIVEYLENPGEKFIFDNYDQEVIDAYKKYIKYLLNSDSKSKSISKTQNVPKENIANLRDKITHEEFYRLNQEEIQNFSKFSNTSNDFKRSVTSSIIQNSNSSSKQEEIPITQYITSFTNSTIHQKSDSTLPPSNYYLNAGTLSEMKGDYENAKKFYMNAIQNGSIQAATKLSILLLRNGDTESKKHGFDLLEFASEKKDKDALFYFGYLLSEGFKIKGLKADKERAAALLEEAGQLGNKRGFFEAASIHHERAINFSSKGKKKLAKKSLSKAILLYKSSFEKYGDEESLKFSTELQSYLDKQE